jgi:CBS domain-containing protein
MTSSMSAFADDATVSALLERLRREPALRAWVLTAPTGALATLGIAMDDSEIVLLLDEVDAMDERPIPVTAADVMSTELITIDQDASVHEAAQVLSENRISGLPVTDADGRLVGILSEFDLIARSGAAVRQVMTHDVVSVREGASIDQVRAVLVSRQLKRVPVMNNSGQLVGLISRADLVRELAYRWQCQRCGNLVRARRAPDGCPKCGVANSYAPAPPLPAVSACPTCGRPLDGPGH